MKRSHAHKKAFIALSSTTLAAGMAHGAVVYTYYNQTIVAGDDNLTFDLNQDGSPDYYVAFDNNNALKPYVNDSVGVAGSTTSFVLSDATDDNGVSSQGLPLTTAGTTIDGTYETAQSAGFFYEDDSANVAGGWNSTGTNIDGYVGLELIDGEGYTHYGWAQFVYNSKTVLNGVTGVLTLVDSGMETQPDVGIAAGQTAEVGPPAFSIPPMSQTNAVGLTVQLTAIGVGNPPPTYQWMAGAVGSGVYTNLTDGGNISGSTSNVLTIGNVTLANEEDYVVVLSNSNGLVTNAVPATLTVVPLTVNPITPSPVLLYTGNQASLNISYASSVPVSFQWRKDGVNLTDGGEIAGALSSNLMVGPLILADTGSYSVILNNTYGAVTSGVDSVTAFTPPTPYQQAVASLSPVVYYSFSETNDPAIGGVTAFDYVGGFNGVYGTNTQNGNVNFNIAGPVPGDGFTGFAATNTALGIVNSAENYPSLVTIPALNLNTNTVTFTTWINPQETEPAYATIISFRSAEAGTANGLNYGPNADLGYHWNDNGNTYNYGSGITPPVDQWSFVALVIAPTNALIYMFNAEGMESATNAYANVVQALNTPGFFGGDAHDPNFIGDMDEVAIFNKDLSENQLTNLYSTAVTGTSTVVPTVNVSIAQSAGSLVLSWNPVAGTLMEAPALSGPWTAVTTTSPYTATITGAQMFFRVKVQ